MRLLLLSLLISLGYTFQASPPLRKFRRYASAKPVPSPQGKSLDSNVATDVSVATYSYPRSIDPIIFNVSPNSTAAAELPTTQIRGRLYFPVNNELKNGSVPLVILFPGRHSDCRRQFNVPGLGLYPLDEWQANDHGECFGNASVVESHRGFDYLGYALASHGYATISIEPLTLNILVDNRQDRQDDMYLNKARARLLFRTVEKAQEWSQNSQKSIEALGFDISGKLDFSNVGLMGHSRGGMAVRLAYNLLQDSFAKLVSEIFDWNGRLGITIKGVVEIAPFDTPENDILVNATGIPWTMIAAGCEDDLIDFAYINFIQRQSLQNLEPNHFINIYGAPHDYFNSEWPQVWETCLGDQTPTWDNSSPRFPSPDHASDTNLQLPFVTEAPSQRAVTQWVMTTFMRSYVGRQADRNLAKELDPATPLSKDLANGAEVGRANPNLARSDILRSMESMALISVTPPARLIQSVDAHAQSAFQAFTQQFNSSILPLIFQKPPFYLVGMPLRLAAPKKYDAVAIELSSPDTEIRIPLSSSNLTKGFPDVTGSCTINIDIARRDNCLLSSAISERSTCSKPRILNAEVIVGDSHSAKVPLKSRFNSEFIPEDILKAFRTSTPIDIGFLPIMWETISLPCPRRDSRLEEVRINISSDESGPKANNTDSISSILYIGPVRMING